MGGEAPILVHSVGEEEERARKKVLRARLGWESAGLACMKSWVLAYQPHTPGMVVCASIPALS